MTPPRVLVVEDEADIVMLTKLFLEPDGYDVSDVRSASAALEAIEREEPDLVLLDLGLPGMDGRDLLRLLAERGTLPRLRVVVVSAHASQATVESAMALGCRGYVYKPFGGADLRKAVAAALAE